MRETKRQLSLHSFYDHTGIEGHLARMAERGWLLCGIGQLFWHYRRIEPRQITFSVCYFPQATIYDPRPSEKQEEFYDLCAHAGWTLAGESGQLQVFYHQGEDPTPIDTDPALEVEAIHQSAKKTFLLANFLLVGVAVMNLGMLLFRLRDDPVSTLANGSTLLSVLAFAVVLLNCVVELCAYFLWRHRARRAAERGEFLPTRSRVWLQRLLLAVLLPAGAWWFAGMLRDGGGGLAAVSMLGVIGMMAAVLGVRKLLKGAGVSAKANLRGTLAACVVLSILFTAAIPWFVVRGLNSRPDPTPEELPLSVADLLEGDFSGYTRSWQGVQSPLLGRYAAYEWPLGPTGRFPDPVHLDYEVIQVKLPALYELCRETKLHERDDWGGNPEDFWYGYAYAPVDPAPWGAEEVYQWLPGDGTDKEADNNQYLLFYPDRVVEISLQWDQPPTPEQMAAVGEKLGRGPL